MNYAERDRYEYYDWRSNPSKIKSIVTADQQKFNLIWLVSPEIDVGGMASVSDALAESIHQYMDKETRAQLMRLPLDFMRYWYSIDHEELALASAMPVTHRHTMSVRAAEAQSRLVVEHDNVVYLSFGRTAVRG